MNLREVQLSSRSVIPVALALPINRGPIDVREHEARRTEQPDAQPDAARAPSANGPVYFFL
jgi:hypothetical protein